MDPTDPSTRDVVPEHARFCRACDGPVGRGRGGRPGRERGTCGWCGAPFDLRPARRPGDVLEGDRGRYEVTGTLGHGSRGWVYAARERPGGDAVVLTRLDGPDGRAAGDLAVDATGALLDLPVPGLVRARDVVAAPEAAGRARHLVLDHVAGHGVDQRRRSGPLAPAEALDVVLGAIPALAGLHARGLLHTDVTPANLRAGPDGITLMDLGSLRRAGDRTSDVWGTTGFLAPEITPGGAGPSVASEVYALGRVVAVLVSDFDHARSHALRLPDPAVTRVLAAHPMLTALLRRATDVDPLARHPDVVAFAEQARAVRAGLDDTARPGGGHQPGGRGGAPAPRSRDRVGATHP